MFRGKVLFSIPGKVQVRPQRRNMSTRLHNILAG